MSTSPGTDFVLRWWAGNAGRPGLILDVLAAPLEWCYRGAMAVRNGAYRHGLLPVHRVAAPVISVGNLGVGGAGKTPVSAWLLAELRRRGRRPALLHSGYADDEPELHRRWSPDAPVLAERDRVAAARRAVAAGADVLVLDDGFQHRRLGRDLDLLLVGSEHFGRRRLLPRGGWREPLASARRASLIAVTRRTATTASARQVAAKLAVVAPGVPVIRLHLSPGGWLRDGRAATPPDGTALAVAAVADPGAFVENAGAAGATIGRRLFWPDHHAYGDDDAGRILADAGGGPIVTTAKDWVKLERLLPPGRVWVLRQEVRVEAGAERLEAALDGVLGA